MIAAVAATAALAGGVVTATQATAAPAGPKGAATADAKDLFAAVYFLQGPAAERLADSGYFDGAHAALKENRSADVATVIARIEKAQPGFFEGFGSRITSGDPRQVGTALKDGQDAIDGTTSKSDKLAVADDGRGAAVVVVNVVAAANAVTAINAVNVAYVVNKVKFWVDKPNGGQLDHEGAVADLTRRLAG
ncbi:hypothetical protein [Streptomyces alkaliterrae]|uniref:Sporulation delaying protein family toxin n=1 Tax=Streptomyces alkaliterrae TaxID=2213162 RepID=A0A5P0Z041_9ACTN|nr:hypothetical protein [Streptomyces alkaliterrae]MBB1256782.1 hypothetical protein [Streptomyces alkaliterrae]MBB1262326.1 hypothetical protein [Streptomyces alkaliterrae]MQS04809.1 hypothetical protein [Streptomyces alkaliterrae]